MQNSLELPVVLPLVHSRRCTAWTSAVHAGAAVLPWFSSLILPGKLLLLVPLLISYREILQRYCRLSHAQSVICVVLNDNDEWWLTRADGSVHQVKLLTPYFVHAHMVILSFIEREERRRTHVILTPDRTCTDSLRRLRIRLRLPRPTETPGAVDHT